MTNIELISKIKAEIERRKSLLTQHSKLTYNLILETFIKEYDSLLSFLSTLESEKPTNMELEDEIDKSINGLDGCFTKINGIPEYHLVTDEELRKFARHFAEWQKKQDEEEQADLFTIVALDATQRAKEQMMQGALNGWLDEDNEPPYDLNVHCEEKIPFGEFKHCDKIRIIIMKEDEK